MKYNFSNSAHCLCCVRKHSLRESSKQCLAARQRSRADGAGGALVGAADRAMLCVELLLSEAHLDSVNTGRDGVAIVAPSRMAFLAAFCGLSLIPFPPGVDPPLPQGTPLFFVSQHGSNHLGQHRINPLILATPNGA